MNIWTDCEKKPLTECIKFIVDNRGKTVPTSETGIILIATNCISNDSLYPRYEKIRYLSKETYDSFFRAHPIAGDIIFVNKGTPGRVCMVPDVVDFCIAQDMIALRVNEKIIDNYYLLSILRSWEIQSLIANTNVGDVIPHFKKQFLNRLLIPIPELSFQKIIGYTYRILSIKIETNNKLNEKLEEMAQAIFKSWFVDFEPFKNQPFHETELGMIPEGWNIYKLGDFFPVVTGKKDANVASKKGIYPFFSCSQSILYTDSYSFEGNAILVAGNGDFNVKYYCGKFEAYQRTYVLMPYDREITSLLFYAMKYYLNQITSSSRGSVIKFITKGNIQNFRIVLPNDIKKMSVIESFNKINEIISNRKKENDRLASLRDTLLPRLMSGEIKI